MRVGPEQLEPFYRVFSVHMRDLGTPAHSFAFFRAIAEEFPEDVRFACAYLNDEPIACGCGFLWGSEFEITWASALRTHKHLAANMLVYWVLMQRAIADGARVFNFGRCTPGSGTHRFKQQWGGRDQALWWYQQSARGDAAIETMRKSIEGLHAIKVPQDLVPLDDAVTSYLFNSQLVTLPHGQLGNCNQAIGNDPTTAKPPKNNPQSVGFSTPLHHSVPDYLAPAAKLADLAIGLPVVVGRRRRAKRAPSNAA